MYASELHGSHWLARATQMLGQILDVSVEIFLGSSKLHINRVSNVDGHPQQGTPHLNKRVSDAGSTPYFFAISLVKYSGRVKWS